MAMQKYTSIQTDKLNMEENIFKYNIMAKYIKKYNTPCVKILEIQSCLFYI